MGFGRHIALASQSNPSGSHAGLAGRAASATVENPLAASLADTQVNAEIHDGPSVRSGHPDRGDAQRAETGFMHWAAHALHRWAAT